MIYPVRLWAPRAAFQLGRNTITTFSGTFRGFRSSAAPANRSDSSLLGQVTKDFKGDDERSPDAISTRLEEASTGLTLEEAKTKVTVENDKKLQEFLASQREAKNTIEAYLSPLKRALYKKVLENNAGRYVNNQKVKHEGKTYKLKLTKEEIELLEPSVYCRSYRIKGTPKKATVLLRMLRGLNVKKAITQCHFSPKRMAKDVAEMLQRGLEDAKALNIEDPEKMYIDQIWVGKDGWWQKLVDIKARGRMGIMELKYVHVRAILKTEMTKERIASYKAELLAKRKPRLQLPSEKIRHPPRGAYMW